MMLARATLCGLLLLCLAQVWGSLAYSNQILESVPDNPADVYSSDEYQVVEITNADDKSDGPERIAHIRVQTGVTDDAFRPANVSAFVRQVLAVVRGCAALSPSDILTPRRVLKGGALFVLILCVSWLVRTLWPRRHVRKLYPQPPVTQTRRQHAPTDGFRFA